MHVNTGAILALQLFERGLGVRIHRKCRRADARLGAARGEAFNLTNRHDATSDFTGDGEARLGIGDGQERARVTRGDATFLEQFLDRLFELEQADGVGDGSAIFVRDWSSDVCSSDL